MKTSRWQWVYPTEGQTSSPVAYDIIETLFNQQDADVYASYENMNLILRGGGTVSLDSETDVLSWTEDFEILSLMTGGRITIEAGNLSGFLSGKIAYINVARPVAGIATATMQIADNIATDTSRLFICMRRGNAVYFRNHADRSAMSYVDYMGTRKITTPVAAASGSVDASVSVGVIDGSVWMLRVKALGNTVDSTIRFFSDSGLTNEIYKAANKDCYGTPHEDRVPWYLEPDSGGYIYYKIDNDGASDSAYEIEFSGMGRLDV